MYIYSIRSSVKHFWVGRYRKKHEKKKNVRRMGFIFKNREKRGGDNKEGGGERNNWWSETSRLIFIHKFLFAR